MTGLATWLLEQYPCKALTNDTGEAIERWITCPARLAFPELIEPKKMEGNAGDPKYSCTLLFPAGADLTVLNQAAADAARAKFGQGVNLKGLRKPFREQGDKDFDGFEAGAVYINCSSQYKPPIFSENKDKIEATDPRVYAGMWVRAKVTCYAYDQAGNKGVAFGLVSLQRLADDEAFKTGGADNGEGMDDVVAVPANLRKAATSHANGAAPSSGKSIESW